MKPLSAVGILLVLLALLGYATGGLTFKHRHKDIDQGPIHISHDTQSTVPLSPVLSTAALVAGLGMVVFAGRAR